MKITPTMRHAAIYGLVAAAALGSVATSTAAHADEAPEFTTVLWSAPGGAQAPWPQTFVTSVGRDDLGAFAGSPWLDCGTYYQVDVYRTTDVAALIADGTLEQGEDYGKALHWTTFTTPACDTAPPVTPVPTATETATPPVTPAPTSTPSPNTEPTAPPVTSSTPPAAPTTSPSPFGASSAPAVSPVPPTSTTSIAASLAFTGNRDMLPFAIAASALVAAGVGLLGRATVLRRRQKRAE